MCFAKPTIKLFITHTFLVIPKKKKKKRVKIEQDFALKTPVFLVFFLGRGKN